MARGRIVSPRVMGHSRLHLRQHHVMITDLPLIVVSGMVVPTVPQKGHFGGTRNVTGVWGTGKPEAYHTVSVRTCSHSASSRW